MAVKKSLFDELYDKADEIVKKLKKPLTKKGIKRKFSAAYDDAENNKIDAELKLQDLRSKFNDFDVNAILEQKLIIEENIALQEKLEQEYEELFGKKMPKSE